MRPQSILSSLFAVVVVCVGSAIAVVGIPDYAPGSSADEVDEIDFQFLGEVKQAESASAKSPEEVPPFADQQSQLGAPAQANPWATSSQDQAVAQAAPPTAQNRWQQQPSTRQQTGREPGGMQAQTANGIPPMSADRQPPRQAIQQWQGQPLQGDRSNTRVAAHPASAPVSLVAEREVAADRGAFRRTEGSSASRAEDAAAMQQKPLPTWREATTRLNELGIRDFRLEPGLQADEFLFSCSYTPADNPRVSRRFEAEATEPLRAVQKVIEQIEQWSRSQ